MPSYPRWKLLQILLLTLYSFALDSSNFLDPLDGLDVAPPNSFTTAQNGITGNSVADSYSELTGEPIIDPQASDLFNSQANPDTIVKLSEGESNACVRGTDLSPSSRRRSKREKQYCDSNQFVAPGAGKRPTAPAGSQEHESGQQQTDETPGRESGKTPSAQDEKKEPSADTKANPNKGLPCNDKEYIHALCGPISASWQLERRGPPVQFMLAAANTCMLLNSSSYPLVTKPERFYCNRSSTS